MFLGHVGRRRGQSGVVRIAADAVATGARRRTLGTGLTASLGAAVFMPIRQVDNPVHRYRQAHQHQEGGKLPLVVLLPGINQVKAPQHKN